MGIENGDKSFFFCCGIRRQTEGVGDGAVMWWGVKVIYSVVEGGCGVVVILLLLSVGGVYLCVVGWKVWQYSVVTMVLMVCMLLFLGG